MLRKTKWPLFALLFGLLISSCTPSPPDVPACEPLFQHLSTDPATGHLLLIPSPTCAKAIGEPECGHCVYIVSGKEIFIGEAPATRLNGKPWSLLKQQAVYLPAQESYAPLATYLINSCKKMGCSDTLTRFKVKLDALNGVAGALSSP